MKKWLLCLAAGYIARGYILQLRWGYRYTNSMSQVLPKDVTGYRGGWGVGHRLRAPSSWLDDRRPSRPPETQTETIFMPYALHSHKLDSECIGALHRIDTWQQNLKWVHYMLKSCKPRVDPGSSHGLMTGWRLGSARLDPKW